MCQSQRLLSAAGSSLRGHRSSYCLTIDAVRPRTGSCHPRREPELTYTGGTFAAIRAYRSLKTTLNSQGNTLIKSLFRRIGSIPQKELDGEAIEHAGVEPVSNYFLTRSGLDP